MTMVYCCDMCGGQSEDPHGCQCGGNPIPSEPLPEFTEGPEIAFQEMLGYLDESGFAVPITAGFEQIPPGELRPNEEGWSHD